MVWSMDATNDLMRYDQLAQNALRSVVREALKRTAAKGLPEPHHFYITFKTQAEGVSIPSDLVEKYPDEMTIVLEHQFWDLAASEHSFSVTLRFGGAPKRLTVPYTAITRFFDPYVRFGLQFDVEAPEPSEQTMAVATDMVAEMDSPAPRKAAAKPAPEAREDAGAKVVSLDRFRKK